MRRPLPPEPSDPILALAFYQEMFPLLVQAVLVAVPALWGMRRGADAGTFRAPLRIVLWTAAIATLAAMVLQEPGFGLFLRQLEIWRGWQTPVLQLVVYWPVVYLIANAIGRRVPGRITSI
jgi:hypothetical protein